MPPTIKIRVKTPSQKKLQVKWKEDFTPEQKKEQVLAKELAVKAGIECLSHMKASMIAKEDESLSVIRQLWTERIGVSLLIFFTGNVL